MKSLKTVCNEADTQDQKTLLLAQIVEDRFTSIQDSIESLKSDVKSLTSAVTQTIEERKTCPVYYNKDVATVMFYFFKYPKLSLLLILGAASMTGIGVKEILIEIFKAFSK